MVQVMSREVFLSDYCVHSWALHATWQQQAALVDERASE